MDRDRLLTVAGHASLVLLGAALGVWDTFLVPVRLPGGIEGLTVLLAFVGNVGTGALGWFGFRTPLATAMGGLGWVVAALGLGGGIPGHAQDVLVPAAVSHDPGLSKVGVAYIVAGAVGAVMAVVWASRRPGTTGG